MRSNPKVILFAVGVAALLASPAMARTVRPHYAAPSTVYARGAVVPYGAAEGGPYTPSGGSRDFQAPEGRIGTRS